MLIFVFFMIITFFLIHNIILSRIFQIYSYKLKQTAIKRCVIHTYKYFSKHPHVD